MTDIDAFHNFSTVNLDTTIEFECDWRLEIEVISFSVSVLIGLDMVPADWFLEKSFGVSTRNLTARVLRLQCKICFLL